MSGFALGVLLGAAKITFIGMVGFGIAWARARSRIRRLEEEMRFQAESGIEARLARVEEGIEFVSSQFQRLIDARMDPVRLSSQDGTPTQDSGG